MSQAKLVHDLFLFKRESLTEGFVSLSLALVLPCLNIRAQLARGLIMSIHRY